ncbi:hypothetical protein C9374_010271 [Naegleria lovaniensis]|uniref:Enoyl reductase (ER) domain-containing protein n=1 Tax=Naegleria lovaniensis TaxID=51637 RepID=A0AA88GC56_NAELO|nr:uncharacterized protein C9374_010271 [Naegleria lovaniensis]KAG2374897.1 hypothetical protein C9374_010271 [Naegleria lovaniensis]
MSLDYSSPPIQVTCHELLIPPNTETVTVSPISQPLPPLANNHLRIRVKYGALNFADVLQVGGKYQEKRLPPFIPGSEIAGVVCEINSSNEVNHHSFQIGDQVLLLAQKDGWQSFIDIPIQYPAMIRVPKSIDLKKAAGLFVAFSTSHVALTHPRHGNLQKCKLELDSKEQVAMMKQTMTHSEQTMKHTTNQQTQSEQVAMKQTMKKRKIVLVLGASGGVGLAACQIAKALGAIVIAACSSDEKCQLCKEKAHADHVINYEANKKDWFKTVLTDFTNGKGCDIIYDPVGGDLGMQSLKCMAWGGVWLVIGFATSHIPQIPANILLVKNCSASGVYWGSYMKHEPQVIQHSMKELFEMMTRGEIDPFISHVYPVEHVVKAMNDMLQRKTIGRVLLSFDENERLSKM